MEKYSRLIIKETFVKRNEQRNRNVKYAICDCECGSKNLIKDYQDVKRGKIKSCGCLQLEQRQRISDSTYTTTHNMTNTRIYTIFNGMKKRCRDKNQKDYGGRGITVCDQWLDEENGFYNFYAWAMNNGYTNELEIDRIDVDGNYEPDNCRWITSLEQKYNKRNTIYVDYNGQSVCMINILKDLHREDEYSRIRHRMSKQGLTFEEALNKPSIKGNLLTQLIECLVKEFKDKDSGFKITKKEFYDKYQFQKGYFTHTINREHMQKILNQLNVVVTRYQLEKI